MNKSLALCSIALMFLLIGCGSSSDNGITNTAPVATDAVVSVLPGNSVSGALEARDADGDSLIFSIVTDPEYGTVSIDDTATGTYTYTLSSSATSDSFTFLANDGLLDSNIATITITGSIASAPTSGLQATPGDQRITLNWDAVFGADSYNVYWSDTPGTGTGGTKISDITPPFYHDALTNGLNYYYVVTTVNAVGESDASIELSATPVDILISSLSFTDANLDACVAAAGAGVTVHELTNLACPGESISNIEGIEALSSLTSLTLSSNSISDISLLSGLISLTYLDIYNNNIIDLSPLSALINLERLQLESNSIVDLSPLSSLTNLGSLALIGNSITDLTPLSGLINLDYLGLARNKITDVSPLSGLTSLGSMHLYDNNITDVSFLSGLTSLTFLDISSNNIEGQNVGNVDDLATLINANILYLYNNIGMSCSELDSLINALNSPPVDIDGDINTTDVATDGVNCTNP